MKSKLLEIMVLSALSLPVIAKAIGGDGSGGGNEIPGLFVADARILYLNLASQKKLANETLGFDIEEFKVAIDTTPVNCAFGEVLEIIRDQRKTAYYLASRQSIYLDCDTYNESKKKGEMGPTTQFHEYMRRIGKEGDEYLASSKLRSIIVPGSSSEFIVIDPGILFCFEKEKLPLHFLSPMAGWEIEFGRDAARCLVEQGFNTKVDPKMSSADILERIGRLVLSEKINRKTFAEGVSKYLKRSDAPPAEPVK